MATINVLFARIARVEEPRFVRKNADGSNRWALNWAAAEKTKRMDKDGKPVTQFYDCVSFFSDGQDWVPEVLSDEHVGDRVSFDAEIVQEVWDDRGKKRTSWKLDVKHLHHFGKWQPSGVVESDVETTDDADVPKWNGGKRTKATVKKAKPVAPVSDDGVDF